MKPHGRTGKAVRSDEVGLFWRINNLTAPGTSTVILEEIVLEDHRPEMRKHHEDMMARLKKLYDTPAHEQLHNAEQGDDSA